MSVDSIITHYGMESVLLVKILSHFIEEKKASSHREFLHLDMLFKKIITIDPKLNYLPKKATAFLRTLLYDLDLNASSAGSVETLNHIFLFMIDSYFEYLGPFKAKLDRLAFKTIFMPRLTLPIHITSKELLIEKTENQLLLVNGRNIECKKKHILLDEMKLLVTSQENYQALFCKVNSSYLTNLSSDGLQPCEYEKLQKSLVTIAIGYPSIYYSIKNLIEFFVPIEKIPQHSVSFILRPYTGVIFLSCNTDELAIAENVIREFCKSIMNIYLKSKNPVTDNSAEYFTPYAESPSSPLDLLTNIFVFIEVCQFFTNCLGYKDFKESTPLLKYRLTVQLHRMKLALSQANKIQWSSLGNELLTFLYKRHEHLIGINKKNVLPRPSIIDQHIKRWNKNYPNHSLEHLTRSLIEMNG